MQSSVQNRMLNTICYFRIITWMKQQTSSSAAIACALTPPPPPRNTLQRAVYKLQALSSLRVASRALNLSRRE